MRLSIGVTGHRDLLPQEMDDLRGGVHQFLSSLQEEFPSLEFQLLSPLAEGADRLTAEVALDLGISVLAVLPMPREEYEKDFQDESSLKAFEKLLSLSERVITMPHEGLPRDRQYEQAGVFISNHCQILLAIWDGRVKQDMGGTSRHTSLPPDRHAQQRDSPQ